MIPAHSPATRRFTATVAALMLAGAILAPGPVHAQTLGAVEQRLDRLEKDVRLLSRKGGTGADESVMASPSDLILQVDARLAAIERALAALVSAREQDHRELEALQQQFRRVSGDVESRIASLEKRTDAPPQVIAAAPTTVAPIAPATEAGPDERFGQAMTFLARKDWPKAEFAFDSFATSYPSDDRTPEARFRLGQSFEGQGKHAQAAQIFLDLYQKYPDAPFALDNLFALAAALAGLGPDSTAQACSVYGEIEAVWGTRLTVPDRARLLDGRLALQCADRGVG